MTYLVVVCPGSWNGGHVPEPAHDADANAIATEPELLPPVAIQQQRWFDASAFVTVDKHVVVAFEIASVPRPFLPVAAQV